MPKDKKKRRKDKHRDRARDKDESASKSKPESRSESKSASKPESKSKSKSKGKADAKRRGGAPKPVCFMVMPFGTKPTGVPDAPHEVDFDALWTDVFEPMLSDLGFEAVRADQDLGASIVKDMLERLVASDLVLADVSVANPNVFYEIGVRHAAPRPQCVLVSAAWARPAFDLAQVRRHVYPLPAGPLTPEDAQAIRDALVERIREAARDHGPVRALVPGYPELRTQDMGTFREFVRRLHAFQQKTAELRRSQSADGVNALVEHCLGERGLTAAVATELLLLVRDVLGWQPVLAFVDRLPPALAELPPVQEQRALALSKLKRDDEAIPALEQLVATRGPSPERHGLLGGCHKRLYRATNNRAELDRAIDHYTAGARLDLNAYYCASNLPRLLRTRNRKGDEARAERIAHQVEVACEAAEAHNRGDEWLRATQLCAAFDAGDVARVDELLPVVRAEGAAAWQLDSTFGELEEAVTLLPRGTAKTALAKRLTGLRRLAGGGSATARRRKPSHK